MRISDWSSDVCSSDLGSQQDAEGDRPGREQAAVGDALGIEEVVAVDVEAVQHRHRHEEREQNGAEEERIMERDVVDLPHEESDQTDQPEDNEVADTESQVDADARERPQIAPAIAGSQ